MVFMLAICIVILIIQLYALPYNKKTAKDRGTRTGEGQGDVSFVLPLKRTKDTSPCPPFVPSCPPLLLSYFF